MTHTHTHLHTHKHTLTHTHTHTHTHTCSTRVESWQSGCLRQSKRMNVSSNERNKRKKKTWYDVFPPKIGSLNENSTKQRVFQSRCFVKSKTTCVRSNGANSQGQTVGNMVMYTRIFCGKAVYYKERARTY